MDEEGFESDSSLFSDSENSPSFNSSKKIEGEAFGELEGEIGLEGFRLLMNDPHIETLPMILETPKGDDPIASDRDNLQTLIGLIVKKRR